MTRILSALRNSGSHIRLSTGEAIATAGIVFAMPWVWVL